MKHVTPIDNPINGYVDGHSDSEDLGIFVLSPESMNIRNNSPKEEPVWLWYVVDNSFSPEDNDFDVRTN